MARINQLAFCLVGVVASGCALPKMSSDYEPSGVGGGRAGSKHSGGSANGAGTTSAAGVGQAGRTNAAGDTSANAGAGLAGQPTATGGALAVGGAAGAPVTQGGTATASGGDSAGATATEGGASNSAGAAGVAGSNGKLTAVAISAGRWHSCALLTDGSIRCWGSQCDGRLGDGGVISNCLGDAPDVFSTTPIQVQGITQATAIVCGGYHTCAIVGGTVQCWGFNLNGELGNGTEQDSSIPVQVIGITAAKAIVAGENHTCALLEDGSVQCWGQNSTSYGQLGNGANLESMVPVPVVTDTATPPTKLTGVTKIASKSDHTCAIRLNGEVYCWGDNSYLQLGSSSSDQSSNIAIKASRLAAQVGGTAATAIGVGSAHSCALLDDGSVRCWGYGSYGELGDGKEAHSATPVLAFSPSSAKLLDLAVGFDHSCVILPNANRPAQCWGDNTYGQVGDGTMDYIRSVPTEVKTIVGGSTMPLVQVQAVSCGYEHTCAIVAGGAVYCWGRGDLGQLGNGGTRDGATAKLVSGF
jgi:alpha-tubulin suppressor-like RCC1 family protein